MKRFGMRKRAQYVGVAGVVAAVAVAVAFAAATAQATPNKPYTANVHQTLNTPGSFTLTLTNDPKASQSLGSANFTPPAGFALGAVTGTGGTGGSGFNVNVVGNVVQFRAKSSAQALGAGKTVSADVTVSSGIAGCTNARWSVEAKQSNDFSGTPGNDLTLNPASDLTPLGSFVFSPVETAVDGANGPIHAPQIVTNAVAPISIKALDTCGNPDSDYSGATLTKAAGLATATLTDLIWSNAGDGSRLGSASLTPVDVEVHDQISVRDPASGIAKSSNLFDVVQKICAIPGTVCTWKDPDPKKPITATSTIPGDSNGQASIGLGYLSFPTKNNVICGAGSFTAVGDIVEIDPFQYTNPYTVVITYDKSLVGTGPASSLIVCKTTDAGGNWTRLQACSNTVTTDCADVAKVSGGNYQVTLHLSPGDPGSGGLR